MAEKLIVTSALPYANGPIHFGHVVGAYLPADIYVRFRRMCGDEVHYVCGTDEHGVAITLRAERANQSYDAYVDRWHEEIRRILDATGIEFDIFSGTGHHRNPHHRELAQQFFLDLLENGYVFERTEEHFYSPALGRFLPDRYIEGTCYICGHQGARGDECPACGSWLDAKKLENPRCSLDGTPPELRPSKHWYLDLPKLRDEWLQGWFDSKTGHWKANVERFVRGTLVDLPEKPITRDLPWGVPVPLPDAEGKVLYVWFDAPIGYLSISKQYFAAKGDAHQFDSLWKDTETKLYHFLGKDNIVFHVVVFPAMLWGTKAAWIVPDNVPANEFLNLEGRKFNTSKGWYIPEDSLAARVPVDALRYALTTMMPETADSDWSWREFQARVNDDLADNFGNFVARTLRFAERFLDGTLPPLGPLTPEDEAILGAGRAAGDEIGAHLHTFAFRRACQRLMAFCADSNRYYDQQQPWVTRKSDLDKCKHTIRVCTELIRSLAILSAPILPQTSAKLLSALGLPGQPAWDDAGGLGLPAGEICLEPLDVLFPKVSDEAIAEELAALQRMSKAAETGEQIA
jgi:methionyl-tRNA synthetase